VEGQPALRIDGDDRRPESTLERVDGATRLPDGSVLVGDRGAFALKWFAPDGTLRRAFGRTGSGPGEIRYLARLLRCGDSVFTVDIAEGHRVSVFTLDGRFVRHFRFAGPPGQVAPYATVCNGSTRFAHMGWVSMRGAKPGVDRGEVPVWVGRSDGSMSRQIDSLPGSERWVIAIDGKIRGSMPLPFGKEPVLGIGRSRTYVGSANRWEIAVYDSSGRQLPALTTTTPLVPVTPADIRARIDAQVAVRGESERASIEATYAGIAFPASWPPYTALLVDADDHVWVRHSHPMRAQSARWSVFSPSGAFVTDVTLPAALHLFEIGRDYVLGRYRDPDSDLPHVQLHRLARGRQ
jgi:hypothetical protein